MIYGWLPVHLMTSLFDLDDQSLGSQEIFKVLTFPSFTLSAANKLQHFFCSKCCFCVFVPTVKFCLYTTMQAKVSHWHPNLSNSNIIFCVYFLFLHNLNMVNYVTKLLLCKEHYLRYCLYQSCTFFL